MCSSELGPYMQMEVPNGKNANTNKPPRRRRTVGYLTDAMILKYMDVSQEMVTLKVVVIGIIDLRKIYLGLTKKQMLPVKIYVLMVKHAKVEKEERVSAVMKLAKKQIQISLGWNFVNSPRCLLHAWDRIVQRT